MTSSAITGQADPTIAAPALQPLPVEKTSIDEQVIDTFAGYMQVLPNDKASVKVLKECIDLQLRKSQDYQSDASTVRQADYYPRGVESIYDMINTKMLRLRSLMDATLAKGHMATPVANFESMRDTAKDLINYVSFFAAYIDGGIDGQVKGRDMFNRSVPGLLDKVKVPTGQLLTESTSAGSLGYPPGTQVTYTNNEMVDEMIQSGRTDRT
jgi:hypothetical protein